MTIAVSLRVADGMVLAADSASTLAGADPGGGASNVFNIYNNANKIYNLHKGWPLGAITCGDGALGNTPISTLAKDLRRRLTGRDPDYSGWELDKDTYTVGEVAQRAYEFLYQEICQPWMNEDENYAPSMSFVISGYSAGSDTAEAYELRITDGGCGGPEQILSPQPSGGEIFFDGDTEAISRLIFGSSPALGSVLYDLGVPQKEVPQVVGDIENALYMPLVNPAMPIQDAIDLAEFLVEASIQFTKFRPGAPIVGGPVEVAAVTKHEGFKWIKRKHYYDTALNSEEG